MKQVLFSNFASGSIVKIAVYGWRLSSLNKLWLIFWDLHKLAYKIWKSILCMRNLILCYIWEKTEGQWRLHGRIVTITMTICWIIAAAIWASYLCIYTLAMGVIRNKAIATYWYSNTNCCFMLIMLGIKISLFFKTHFLLCLYINCFSSYFYNAFFKKGFNLIFISKINH